MPSRTSARLSQFRLAMDKVFVASIRSVFVSAPKVSLVFFKLLFYFRNFQRPRQIPDYKNFTAYLWQLLLLLSLLQGAWHLSTYAKEDNPRREKQETDGARDRNRNQNRIDMNCERLRYFRFGHLPDYFVLCLRIGASSKHCTAVEVEKYRGKNGQVK